MFSARKSIASKSSIKMEGGASGRDQAPYDVRSNKVQHEGAIPPRNARATFLAPEELDEDDLVLENEVNNVGLGIPAS